MLARPNAGCQGLEIVRKASAQPQILFIMIVPVVQACSERHVRSACKERITARDLKAAGVDCESGLNPVPSLLLQLCGWSLP